MLSFMNPQKTKNIILIGASGRMGQSLLDLIQTQHAKGHHEWSVILKIARDLDVIWNGAPGDVVIDFSNAAMTADVARFFNGKEIPLLICSTGLSDETRATLRQCSARCPVMIAPNTSAGVITLHKLLKIATQLLDDTFDINIVETHHRHKVDAPSGTSLSLKQTIQATKAVDVDIHSLRAGDIFTDHTITYHGHYETIKLSHSAYSRNVYAAGALRLASWLVQQSPGFYEPENVS